MEEEENRLDTDTNPVVWFLILDRNYIGGFVAQSRHQ